MLTGGWEHTGIQEKIRFLSWASGYSESFRRLCPCLRLEFNSCNSAGLNLALIDEQLRQELLAVLAEDVRVREELVALGVAWRRLRS
jgi:hypothetical protein